MKEIHIVFEKYIQDKQGNNILKLQKTNTNRYYLLDMENNQLASGKDNILRKIKEIYTKKIFIKF